MEHLIWRYIRVFLSICLVGTLIACFSIHVFGTIYTCCRFYLTLSKHILVKSTSTLKDSNKTVFISSEPQACIHPDLPLWNKELQNYFKNVKPVTCTDKTDWVYTRNGKFYISISSFKANGEIKCRYVPIDTSHNDTFRTLKPIQPMLNESTLISDAFKVSCKSETGKLYNNIHACIAPQSFLVSPKATSSSNKFNVLIFGFDSLSRLMFKRFLPKTHEYFTDLLGGVLLESYNIVGDGTTQALLPLLTGYRETEMPEARRGKPGAKQIDELVDFIWKRYERRGYVTQWAEDLTEVGTFHYRLLGFKNKPVTHYMRPFYLAQKPFTSKFNRYCLGSRTRHQVYLDWLKEGIETNKDKNFFTFGFFSEYTHNDNNLAQLADEDNVVFFKFLKSENILDKTFLIVMSDHGLRYGSIRNTEQGKLEERMPYFGILVPQAFRKQFPHKYNILRKNRKRLVIPSDIHETLLDILGDTETRYIRKRTVYSLFSSIPGHRTCSDAAIEPHWCACLTSKAISVSDPNIKASVNKVVSFINSVLLNVSAFCHTLSLQQIKKSFAFETNNQIMRFKQSSDLDGRVPVLNDTLHREYIHYIITFETIPGNGLFEATVIMNKITGEIKVSENAISRLNRYNDAPKCIASSYPSLRPYCDCK